MRQLARTVVRLDVETKSYHAMVDAPWVELLHRGDQLSPLDYGQHLARVYGFDAPLAAAFAYTPHLAAFFELHDYARAGLIAQDLIALGVKARKIANLGQCMIAPFTGPAEACGWLYVHTRSILLHDALRAALIEQLPELECATSYLGAFTGRTDAVWDEFAERLDRVAKTKHIQDRIVAAAFDAFTTARDWFGGEAHELRKVS